MKNISSLPIRQPKKSARVMLILYCITVALIGLVAISIFVVPYHSSSIEGAKNVFIIDYVSSAINYDKASLGFKTYFTSITSGLNKLGSLAMPVVIALFYCSILLCAFAIIVMITCILKRNSHKYLMASLLAHIPLILLYVYPVVTTFTTSKAAHLNCLYSAIILAVLVVSLIVNIVLYYVFIRKGEYHATLQAQDEFLNTNYSGVKYVMMKYDQGKEAGQKDIKISSVYQTKSKPRKAKKEVKKEN